MIDRQLALGQHLGELRRRLIIATLATMATTTLSFIFYKQVIRLLLRIGDFASKGEEGPELIFVNVTEMVGVTVKLSLVAGLVLASPVIIYQIVMFVAPGLSPREKRYLLAFLPGGLLCFAAGVAFGYFVLIPPAIDFLLGFGSDLATPTIRISNYINVTLMLLFWLGVVFETPLVMSLLAKLGIVTARGFARFRRYWFVVAFILAALITPTFDPLNQLLVAIPLILLYEVGIWLSKLATYGRPQPHPGVAASEPPAR